MTLAAFLQDAASRPVQWGVWDCHLWLADWVLASRGGADPAVGLRGRYRTPRGALRVLGREGGSQSLVGRLAQAAQLCEVEPSAARAGDIGLLPLHGPRGFELIGGLHTGARWAALAWPAGIVAHPFPAARAWRI